MAAITFTGQFDLVSFLTPKLANRDDHRFMAQQLESLLCSLILRQRYISQS